MLCAILILVGIAVGAVAGAICMGIYLLGHIQEAS